MLSLRDPVIYTYDQSKDWGKRLKLILEADEVNPATWGVCEVRMDQYRNLRSPDT